MLISRLPDVAAPDAVLGVFCLVPLILLIVGPITKATVLTMLKWDAFRRSLVAALVMNLVSSVLLIVLSFVFEFNIYLPNVWLWVIAASLISVFIECGVLMLFRRDAARQNLIAAWAVNAPGFVALLLLSLLLQ